MNHKLFGGDWVKTWIRHLEKVLSKTKAGIWAYSTPYRNIVQREIDLAGINASDTVLFIGAGSIPFTPILLVRLTGARVITIERDVDAYENALKVIKKADMTHEITVLHDDGSAPLDVDYQVLIFALQASPMAKLLRTHSRKNARTIIRRASEAYQQEYDQPPDAIMIIDEATHGMRAFEKSQLITYTPEQ